MLIYQLNKRISLAISIFLSYLIISVGGLLIGKYFFYLILIYFLYISEALFRDRLTSIKNSILKNLTILDLIGVIIFSFSISILLLEREWIEPGNMINIFREGFFHDEIYHMSISSMIFNHLIPSTGLNSTPYLNYHYLVHIISAGVMGITNLNAYDIIPLINIFFVYPVFIFLINKIFHGIRVKENGIFLFSFFLFLPFTEIQKFQLMDFTYPFSLLILFSFIYSLQKNYRIKNYMIFIPISYFAKLSSGLIISSWIVSYSILKYRIIPKKVIFTVIFIILSIISLKLVRDTTIENNEYLFSILSFIFYNKKHINPLLYLSVIYFPFTLFLIIYLFKNKLNININQNTFTFILLTGIWSFAAINIISPAGNNIYFVASPYILSLPFVISTMIFLIKKNYFINIFFYSFILISIIIGSYNYIKEKNEIIGYFDTKNKSVRSDSGRSFEEEKIKEFSMYIDTLVKISKRDDLKDYLVEIPEDQLSFWQYCKWVSDCRSQVSFLIPAIANKPAYNGYNDETMRNKKVFGFKRIDVYGYGNYYKQPDLSACEYRNVKGLITIKLEKKDIQLDLKKC
tara:strand:- start:15735 stop:17453 length:1719 start_codon:yes stop_codon:yes gene_type:complete